MALTAMCLMLSSCGGGNDSLDITIPTEQTTDTKYDPPIEPDYEQDTQDSQYEDSDCYNESGWKAPAYSNPCYDKKGYDQEGYSRSGRDRRGFDRDGYNLFGVDKDGYDRDGYDRRGRDRDGYDRDGRNMNGFDTSGCDPTTHLTAVGNSC